MKAKLTRQMALAVRPIKIPPIDTEARDGKLYVSVKYQRPRWQRMLGADNDCQRTYGLDAYGKEVYDSCNGSATVKNIIHKFGKQHGLSRSEAEKAVTTFMKTLMGRGLIGMAMKEPKKQ